MKCGREPGGTKSAELGVCPAATYKDAHGFLGGKNAGRACAFVSNTFYGGGIQGTYTDKEKNCGKCDFFMKLKQEHGNEATILSFNKFMRDKKRLHNTAKFSKDAAKLAGFELDLAGGGDRLDDSFERYEKY